MNKAPKVIGVVAIFLLAGLVGYAGWAGWIQPSKGEEGLLGGANSPVDSSVSSTQSFITYFNKAQDVVGTHTTTSTVGVASPTKNVTTSYVSKVEFAKNAVYQIKITAATDTANNTDFTVQGSTDGLCETVAGNASSTTDVVQKDINWYDATVYASNRVHPTTYGVGSSTQIYNIVNANANTTALLNLTGLNFRCLRFSFSASSTAVHVGLMTSN